jgi:UDP-N-acetylglucosamine 2-epimerase
VDILSIVGARPQFIKAAAVSRAVRKRHHEVIVHTGQHYDDGMSALFFRELGLPEPDHHLGVGSGSHGEQTGHMLIALERVIAEQKADLVMVYGDTNSTLAGALAAAKAGIPVAHVEAGCRSYDRTMPEEINRVAADHLSSRLFCPTARAVENLAREGITAGVDNVGDVMLDLLREQLPEAERRSKIVESLKLAPSRYLVVTVHRAANTDQPDRLSAILGALESLEEPVVFPVHPRTRKAVTSLGRVPGPSIRMIEPVGYHDMMILVRHARMVLTDSGGIQKEAFFLGTPCVTLRETTEWAETVEAGWNRLVGVDRDALIDTVRTWKPAGVPPSGMFGDGHASQRIAEILGP